MPTEDQTLAVRLRTARVDAGITQVQLAAALGVEQPLVSHAETGRWDISAERAAEFLAAIERLRPEVAAQKIAHELSLEIALAQVAIRDDWFPPRRVFPLRGKTPLVKWTKQATSDPHRVESLWRARSEADGVGWVIPDGYVILDVDDPDTFLGLGLDMPLGPIQSTFRGGHVVYAVDPAVAVRQGPVPGADLKVGGKGFVKIYSADAFTKLGTILQALGPTTAGAL